MWIVLIFLFFLAFGGGFGGGFGNNGGVSQVDRDVLTGTATNAQATYTSACGTQKEVLENRYATLLGFNNTQAQMASCCCDIKTAIHSEGEATRALINANTIQDLRDNLQAVTNQLSQTAQNNTLIAALRPTPVPAYLTCSPYMSTYAAYAGLNGYGYSDCGC
jgi:hypothetical protein